VPSSPLGTWEHVADNMGTRVGTFRPGGRAVSVHPDRGAWVVRWRDNGAQRARRFKTEAEALAAVHRIYGGWSTLRTDPRAVAAAIGRRRKTKSGQR
jgi:hypothetical protein